MTTEDAFLAGILARPADPAPRLIFADWLDERGPTPVQACRIPKWLRLGWFPRRGQANLIRPLAHKLPSAAGWDVAMQIDRWLLDLGGRSEGAFDHWGRTAVAGRLCFVNEPYAGVEAALAYLQPLADLFNAPLAFARRSWHGDKYDVGCVRVLLFPPLPPG